jgi:predicted DNA-binding transcriptional regulator AlpA
MRDPDLTRRLLTAEAARYCGSTASTFEKLRVYGGGPTYLKIGRRVVYDPSDLDAWLASCRRSSTSAADSGQREATPNA